MVCAYDTVQSDNLEAVILKFGFTNILVEGLMKCIWNPSNVVLINGLAYAMVFHHRWVIVRSRRSIGDET